MSDEDVLDDIYLNMSDEKIHELVHHRGGCRCFISPPCAAHSEKLTRHEAEVLGWWPKEQVRQVEEAEGHIPFQNVVQALYGQDESPAQLRKSLVARGYDVDAITDRIKRQVANQLEGRFNSERYRLELQVARRVQKGGKTPDQI